MGVALPRKYVQGHCLPRWGLLEAQGAGHAGCCTSTHSHLGAARASQIPKCHSWEGEGRPTWKPQGWEDLVTLTHPHLEQTGRLRPSGNLVCQAAQGAPRLFPGHPIVAACVWRRVLGVL